MDIREQFEKETRESSFAYLQKYAGAPIEKDGFSDEYVEWLESKVKKLNIDDVSNNEVALIEPLRNFIRSKHLSKEWETFLKDYNRNL